MKSADGRKQRALDRLIAQLKSGQKPMKAGEGTTVNQFVSVKGYVPITDKDKERIQKEITILKSKLSGNVTNN